MKPLAIIIFAVGLSLFGPAANAEILVGSYRGVVNQTPLDNGYFDYGDIFGLGANADLAGLPISGAFFYDPTGSTQPCPTAPLGSEACTFCYSAPSNLGGGIGCNYYRVVDLITTTIERHTIAIFGNYDSELTLTSGAGLGNAFALLAINDARIDVGLLVRTFSGQFSVNEFNPASPDFSVTNPDQYIGQLFLPDNSGFNFSITHFDVHPVPEPPTLWVFLSALGFVVLVIGRGQSRLG